MRRFRSLSAALSLHAWLALWAPSAAFASPTYPPTIQAQLGLAQAPDCTLCHRDDVGGIGTVVRPFGRTMVEHFGLTGGSNIAALRAALEGDDAEHLDSDGDGIADIDELRAGTNPNVGASGVEAAPDVPLPETGCAFVQPSATGGTALLVLVGMALVLARRRTIPRARLNSTKTCHVVPRVTQLQTASTHRDSGVQQ
jgi:hypothetical protein